MASLLVFLYSLPVETPSPHPQSFAPPISQAFLNLIKLSIKTNDHIFTILLSDSVPEYLHSCWLWGQRVLVHY
jgi:hypothetical protein